MSILYNFKVVEAEKVRFPIEKIIDYCYDAMGDNFRRDLKSFDANLTEEPSKIKSERFVHLMKELSESCKIKGDYNIFTKSCYFHEDLFENLRCSSKSNEVSQDLFYYSDFMWNNLFSELMGKEEDIVDVVKIKLEVVSIHPDAGFPWYRLNARTTKFDERRFLVRLLSDIRNDNLPDNPIEKWFGKRGKTTNEDAGCYGGKILWGFLREKKSIKIKPNNKAFWKKHQDRWWSYLEDYFDEPSDYKPYEVVTYEIIIHPTWFKELDDIVGGIYESTAHWM